MAKTSDFFDQSFIDEMKSVLILEKAKLEKSLSRIAHRNVRSTNGDYDADFPNFGDDEDENASEVAMYSDNLSIEQELEKALRDVNNSLKRIEDGTYGICKYTGEAINQDRLRARPTSTSSIASKRTLTQEF